MNLSQNSVMLQFGGGGVEGLKRQKFTFFKLMNRKFKIELPKLIGREIWEFLLTSPLNRARELILGKFIRVECEKKNTSDFDQIRWSCWITIQDYPEKI